MPYADPEKQKKYVREWIAARKAAYFADKCCVRCHSTENLELDHIDPKLKVSHSIWSWSSQRRAMELAKCQVLCKPCHKEKTKQDKLNRRKHGTINMYNRGKCRCDSCKAANYRRVLENRYNWN